jgi:hypothetical protein
MMRQFVDGRMLTVAFEDYEMSRILRTPPRNRRSPFVFWEELMVYTKAPVAHRYIQVYVPK